MALSGTDHIEALRAQLNNNLKEKEAEILEIREVLRALGDAPKILSGKPTTNLGTASATTATRTFANRNVTKLVREYVAAHDATPININEVRDDLRKQGVKGKDRSLYSAIHVILKKEANEKHLRYEKGIGFFKPGGGEGGGSPANAD